MRIDNHNNTSPALNTKRLGLVFVLALIVCVADQATKWLAESRLTPGRYIPLIGDHLGFTLVYNPGASFGMAAGLTWLLTLLSITVTIVIIRYARNITSIPWAITLGCFLGGSIGNLIDRIFREPSIGQGHVVDFISYSNWFVGNVADIALVLGALSLGILVFRNIPMNAVVKDDSVHDSNSGEQLNEPTP